MLLEVHEFRKDLESLGADVGGEIEDAFKEEFEKGYDLFLHLFGILRGRVGGKIFDEKADGFNYGLTDGIALCWSGGGDAKRKEWTYVGVKLILQKAELLQHRPGTVLCILGDELGEAPRNLALLICKVF